MMNTRGLSPSAQTGFTLLELLITLVIAGILLAVATPSFRTMVANSAAENAFGLIEMDLAFARNNAITRGVIVRMTPSSGGFADGWIIETYNGTVAGDVLRRRDGLDDRVSVTSSDFTDKKPIGFTATGQIETTGNLTITTTGCAGRLNRTFSLMTSGQIAIAEADC